jgi:hypothetical protein
MPSPVWVPVEASDATEATGTDDPELSERLLNQIYETLWMPAEMSEEDRIQRVRSAVAALRGIKPQDEVEGMLATQMVATHNAAIECLRRSMIQQQTFEGRESSLRHAAKLLSIFAKQLETLNRNRSKGQQKVTVEYVNVEPGGQAVVGNIESNAKRPRKKTKQSPPEPAKALEHKPGEVIDIDLTAKTHGKVPAEKQT